MSFISADGPEIGRSPGPAGWPGQKNRHSWRLPGTGRATGALSPRRGIYGLACAFFLLACLWAVFLARPALAGAGDQLMTRLANGLTVYILRDARFPLVCTRLYVRAGSGNEAAAQAGISHVLEHMVFKGAGHRPNGQVARDVEALGGYLNAATSFDRTWYITDMPAAHWRIGMDVVRDMAFQATLDATDLEAEKEVVISELRMGKDSPMRQLYEDLQVAALARTPYGRPIIGFEEAIRKLTPQDLRDYVAKWYQPRNMFLLVAGDLEPEAVLAHARELFGGLANHGDEAVAQPLDLEDAAGGPALEVRRGPWTRVYIGVSFPVPGLRDLRSLDLDMLAFALGGDGASEFYRKYKYERELVDSISVDNMSLLRAGMFSISASLDAARLEEFWTELTRDLARLPGFEATPQALDRGRLNMLDDMDRSAETLNGLASWKGIVEFDLGGEQAEMNRRFALKNAGAAQLREAAAAWLGAQRARVRVLAPENAVLPDLAGIMAANWPGKKAVSAGGDAAPSAGGREEIDLGGGRRLILQQDQSAPYLAMQFMLEGGNALLSPGQEGLSDLCGRLLTDGSGDLDAQGMERWFSGRASSVSVRSGLQSFGIAMSGPSRHDGELFAMLASILQKPRFEQAELEREINNMNAERLQRRDAPLSYMFSRLNPFLFPGGQPYGYDPLGSESTLASLGRGDVLKFWQKQSAMPWVLAVTGSFDRDALLAMAKTLPMPGHAGFRAPEPAWGAARKDELTLPGRNQAHLLQVYRTVPPTDPDAPALALLRSLLSGQSGPLFASLRDEKSLGYTVAAFNRSMPKTGFLAFYIGTTPAGMEESRKSFAAIAERLAAEDSPRELLESAANRLLGDYERGRQSLAARSAEAAADAILGYPPDFQKELIEKAARATPADIRRVAAKYLQKPNEWEMTLLP